MNRIVNFLATGFYSGLSPYMPGTVGSLAAMVICFIYPLAWWQILLVLALGIPICARGGKNFGSNDPPQVVFDEFCGMFIAAWRAAGTSQIILGFLLFRLFDIWKPYPVNKLQELPGGWGIMADDLAAGLLARLILALLYL